MQDRVTDTPEWWLRPRKREARKFRWGIMEMEPLGEKTRGRDSSSKALSLGRETLILKYES